MVEAAGRELQRYDGNFRMIAGCVPYRVDNNGITNVLMIKARNRDDYIFPKGGWNSNESESEAAARECLEEAGITGRIEKNLGVFEFVSPKGKPCRLHASLLLVENQLLTYAENDRERVWLSIEEAVLLSRSRPEMAFMMDLALCHLKPGDLVQGVITHLATSMGT